MLRLDLDDYQEIPRLKLLKLFFSLPRPFYIRFSSGGLGLHLKAPLLPTMDYRRDLYDDPMRVLLDDFRSSHGLVYNLQWDVKEGKTAGEWIELNNELDIVKFIDRISVEQ